MKSTTLIATFCLIILNTGSSHAEDVNETSTSVSPQGASSFPSPSTTNSLEAGSHQPSLRPTTAPPTSKIIEPATITLPSSSPEVTISPSPPGTATAQDSASTQLVDSCQNTQGWAYDHWIYVEDRVTCDDVGVQCHDQGNLGSAKDHCCKCKKECAGLCKPQNDDGAFGEWAMPHHTRTAPPSNENDDEDDSSGVLIFIAIIACSIGSALGVVLVCGKLLHSRTQLAQTRHTMTVRRQHQRESSVPSISEEDRHTARYEQMLRMFHFQTVQEDRLNIAAESLREENLTIGTESGELKMSDVAHENCKEPALIERLSVWGVKPSSTDGCCICLEPYTKGERVCVPITQRCNHLFHEECIFEWIQKQSRCPLCRVELNLEGAVPHLASC